MGLLQGVNEIIYVKFLESYLGKDRSIKYVSFAGGDHLRDFRTPEDTRLSTQTCMPCTCAFYKRHPWFCK